MPHSVQGNVNGVMDESWTYTVECPAIVIAMYPSSQNLAMLLLLH